MLLAFAMADKHTGGSLGRKFAPPPPPLSAQVIEIKGRPKYGKVKNIKAKELKAGNA
jgi:hypothetical protein